MKNPDSYDGEEWKPLAEDPLKYQISNMGRVWSNARIVASPRGKGQGRSIGGKELTVSKAKKSIHYRVSLAGKLPRRSIPVYVGEEVLKAFVGPKPEGATVMHIDGNPANNNLDNLKWSKDQKAR